MAFSVKGFSKYDSKLHIFDWLADIPGNDDVKRALRGMADSGRVAHAMLFYENEGCGGLPMALAYFQYLNCQDRRNGDSCGECPSCRKISRLIHPDLHFVFPVNSGAQALRSVPRLRKLRFSYSSP